MTEDKVPEENASSPEGEDEEDIPDEEMFDEKPAMDLKLTDEQVKIAARVQNLVDAKKPNGEYVFTNLEVRDFICACIFELGLPVTAELEAVMFTFLDDVEVPQEDPTPEELLVAVRAYFEATPLNQKLSDEFAALGRDELARSKEGFKNDSAERNAARASAGLSAEPTRAPQAESSSADTPKPKLKKGLS